MSTGAQIVTQLSEELMDAAHTIWPATEKLNSLNRAVHELYPYSWLDKEGTLTTVAGVHEYALPASLERLYAVQMDLGTDAHPRIILAKGWYIREGVSPKVLVIPIGPSFSAINKISPGGEDTSDGYYPAGKTTRVLYEQRYANLINDATAFEGRLEDENLIIELAKSFLFRNRLARALFNKEETRLFLNLAEDSRIAFERGIRLHRKQHHSTIR